MNRLLTLLSAAAILAMTGSAIATGVPTLGDDGGDRMLVTERTYDGAGNLLAEKGIMTDNPLVGFVSHYLHLSPSSNGAKPGGGGPDPGTDCESDAYKLGGWHWTSAYSAKASDYASIFSASGNTWDAATSAAIFGSITSGNDGTPGVQDFKNNIGWANLGASTTIAVTTTWYYRGSGEAVESDGQYNTYYPWSTNGAPNAMDVENIATHEVGHTFGLGHPNGPAGQIGCLTMYAYADYGETQKRTLGDGDILGIQAIYGA